MHRLDETQTGLNNRTRILLFAAIVVLLVAAASGSLAVFGGGHGPAPVVGSGSSGGHAPVDSQLKIPVPDGTGHGSHTAFSISGDVAGLYPGAVEPMVLTVTNHDHVDIVVSSMTATVTGAPSNCAAANVSVTSFTGSLLVHAHQTANTTVMVSMGHGAPDGCQGAQFTFGYLGTGSEA